MDLGPELTAAPAANDAVWMLKISCSSGCQAACSTMQYAAECLLTLLRTATGLELTVPICLPLTMQNESPGCVPPPAVQQLGQQV